ncbi:Ribokinase [archaeon HR03]|nr:Ribokinase [archaeon HR03]
MSSFEVVVVGSLHMDLIVKLARIPAKGETVIGGSFQLSPGGKGANQAVAAARLGASVAIVGRVGSDLFGDLLLERLRKENVATDYVVKDVETHSGVALIMVDKDGNNLIAVASGADARCSPSDVDAAENVIASSKAILTQLEIPLAAVERGVAIARRHEVPVILNAAPAQRLPRRLLEMVDVVVANRIEASVLTGVRVNDVSSAVRAGKRLLAMGVKYAVVTLGRRGAVTVDRKETVYLRGVKVKAVDATGAGDAFCGALAFGLVRGIKIHDAAELANNAAALATTKLGAQEAMPTLAELHKFMASNGRAKNLESLFTIK